MDNNLASGTFFRFPKRLIEDSRYYPLSIEAKNIYVFMLNRVGLSDTNEWKDQHGKTFIYYTNETAAHDLNCGRTRVLRAMKELEDAKLIVRKRQGQGKPMRVYVTDIDKIPISQVSEREVSTSCCKTAQNPDDCKTAPDNAGGITSAQRVTEPLDNTPRPSNKNEKNKNDMNKNENIDTDTTSGKDRTSSVIERGNLTRNAIGFLSEIHALSNINILSNLLFETISTPSHKIRVDNTITNGYDLAERLSTVTIYQLDNALTQTENSITENTKPYEIREKLLSSLFRLTSQNQIA